MQEDLECLRQWRNDPNNSRYLKKINYITVSMQNDWYQSYCNDSSIFTFAIIDDLVVKGIVGSVSIYDIKDGVGEVGKILIGDSRAHRRGIGRIAMALAMTIGFQYMGIKTFHASVHKDNIAAYHTYLSIGFTYTGHHESIIDGGEDDIVIDYDSLNKSFPNISLVEMSSR